MATDNHIKNFTALDIEKYHKGQLSPKERHALEKAALDDPFLADALEGYAVAGVNVNADIAELKKRLAQKTEQAKVIPIQSQGGSSFPWLRAAVMVILIAGAGVLAYQFLFKGNKDQAVASNTVSEKNKASETAKPSSDSNNTFQNGIVKTEDSKATTGIETEKQKSLNTDADGINDKFDSVKMSSKTVSTDVSTSAATSAPVKVAEEKADDKYKLNDNIAKKQTDEEERKTNVYDAKDLHAKEVAKNESDKQAEFKKPATANNNTPVTQTNNGALNEVVVNGYATVNTNRKNDNAYRNANVFRGRVTDANNNALPFANITNNRDNVGTYSDAQGNFTLVSTDSLMDVQVRSLGFQNRNIQLRNTVADNKVMMQEDRSLPVDTLDKVKRNISSKRKTNMTFEEPEPEDGWDSYGSYVLNNLNIPETFDTKKEGDKDDNTVEVSFEVNKNGEPVNIRVEKSLCDKCDQEAKRLIKEGPKWKRKAKKSTRITVTVPFKKPE